MNNENNNGNFNNGNNFSNELNSINLNDNPNQPIDSLDNNGNFNNNNFNNPNLDNNDYLTSSGSFNYNNQNMDNLNNFPNNNPYYYPNNAYSNGFDSNNMPMDPFMNNGFNNFDNNNNNNNEDNKKKKKKKSPVFIIIIILVILAIGAGLFFYLRISSNQASKSSVTITTKDVTFELGQVLSKDVNKYATITQTDSKNCSVDLSKVDTNKAGTYEYTVKCGTQESKGKLKLQDTTVPKVTLKDVNTYINGSFTADDFIDVCDDFSTCTAEFVKENVKSYASKEGSYEIGLKVTDESGNETTVIGTLNVKGSAPVAYYTCSKKDEESKDYVITQADKLGLTAQNVFSQIAVRTYLIKFNKDTDYLKIKNNYENDKSYQYNDYEGKPVFDDKQLTLYYENSLGIETLNKESGSTFPTNVTAIRTYYLNKGYTCQIERINQ